MSSSITPNRPVRPHERRRRIERTSLLAIGCCSVLLGAGLFFKSRQTNPPSATVIEVDITASVGEKPFETMKARTAESLSLLVGKQVSIRKFGTTCRVLWEGYLSSTELPRIQALVRAMMQESDHGTGITQAAMDGAAYLAAVPGAHKELIIETDGIEDIDNPLREIPVAFRGNFQGLHIQFLFLRNLSPRAADLATVAGSEVVRLGLEPSGRALIDSFAGVQHWQHTALPISVGFLSIGFIALAGVFALRPPRPVPPPAQRVWVGVTLSNGQVKGQSVCVGEDLLIGTTSAAAIQLPTDWPALLLILTPVNAGELQITNEARQDLVLGTVPPTKISFRQTVQAGDGERIMVSPTHTLRVVVRDSEPGDINLLAPATSPTSDSSFAFRM